MKRRTLLFLVPPAVLAAGCSGYRPGPEFDVSTAPVQVAEAGRFPFQAGAVDQGSFVRAIHAANEKLGSYKLTILTPAGGGTTRMQVLRELDQDGTLRLHASGDIGGNIDEVITVGDKQWVLVDGKWEDVAGVLIAGGEGDKVTIFARMVTSAVYEDVDEHGHRFATTMDTTGYEHTDEHDHGDHNGHDEHEDPTTAEAWFWTDASMRVVRLQHKLDDETGQRVTIETRTAFNQRFGIKPPR